MNGWRDTTIGGLGRVVTGSTPPSKHPDWFGDDLPFVTPSDITFGNRRPRPERWLSQSGRDGLRTRVVPPGSAAFVCIGATIGKVCLVETEAITNQQINTVIPGPHTDSRFLYSLLRHLAPTVTQGASGATTPIINKSAFSAIPVRIPDLETQVRIGEVLGALDDLIENNRRRVEVLEEMARAIYREWFVKFRYPGYEDVPLVGSALGPIPEEWTVRRLDELATFVGGSTRTKAAYVDAGYVAFSAAGPDGFVPDYEVDGPGVVLSAVGAKCGRTFWASGKWSSIANTIKILPKEPELFANWLRFATDDSSVWPKRGSAQPFVSINDARGVLSRVATRETHLRFEDAVKPMVDQAVVLEAGARGLAALRDLLLPKLVTGQIDVTSLDLDAAIAEQVA
ncbi:restriction endonuclease subunit S [Aestuariimicrobium sp. p3-SID1156]|uniref:restriction endonuclease subunit S n=1 Tax=Aestuariimicrobium sp. p3-SID1156 TaxID=2916038 RepID=UPI00223B626C|nr:restriction endonuclease subunit S [Aestuariimicrobium sp. p3-SID1156]MCT1459628.1 restriction endonuclease subunit S [Aestuariimicrobium sp. p3-SID1156]